MDPMILVVALAAQAAPAIGTAPFTLECQETQTNQYLTNIGRGRPFDQQTTQRTQRYIVDPGARTVTVVFQSREGGGWVEDPQTFRNALFTRAGRVVFCTRTDGGRCLNPLTRTESVSGGQTRTVTSVPGQTIIHLARNTVTYWFNLSVDASDRSYFTSFGATEGTCRRV